MRNLVYIKRLIKSSLKAELKIKKFNLEKFFFRYNFKVLFLNLGTLGWNWFLFIERKMRCILNEKDLSRAIKFSFWLIHWM